MPQRPNGTKSACRARTLPVLVLIDSWASFFPERVVALARDGGERAAHAARGAPAARLHRRAALVSPARARRSAACAARRLRRMGNPIRQVDARDRSTSRARVEQAQYFLPLAIAFEDVPESRWLRLQPCCHRARAPAGGRRRARRCGRRRGLLPRRRRRHRHRRRAAHRPRRGCASRRPRLSRSCAAIPARTSPPLPRSPRAAIRRCAAAIGCF